MGRNKKLSNKKRVERKEDGGDDRIARKLWLCGHFAAKAYSQLLDYIRTVEEERRKKGEGRQEEPYRVIFWCTKSNIQPRGHHDEWSKAQSLVEESSAAAEWFQDCASFSQLRELRGTKTKTKKKEKKKMVMESKEGEEREEKERTSTEETESRNPLEKKGQGLDFAKGGKNPYRHLMSVLPGRM